MKKDCGYTRKLLRKYLRGHLFKYEQVRIARHLSVCPFCRSELQALRKVADTKQLLRDITPSEGLARMKEGVRILSKLRLLAYRPLWLFAIIGVAALVYINIISPGRRDVEIESLEKSIPVAVEAKEQTAAPAASSAVPEKKTPSLPAKPDTAPDPLPITISVIDQQEAVPLINEVMGAYNQLRNTSFSEKVWKISGRLTAEELLAFLDRIGQAGKISYSRKRFRSFPAAQPIPFTLRIKSAPKIAEQASPSPAVHQEPEAPAPPVSAPTSTTR